MTTPPRGLRTARPRPRNLRSAGLTLIEIMVAFVIFAITAGGIVTSLLQARQLNGYNRELSTAVEAAESLLEELYAEEFDRVFASFNADPADDPDGPGTALGASFVVQGLTLQAGDADGRAGEILFPTVGGQLREDVNDPLLGMPRDLDLDLNVDGADHATDYRVLPVVVRVRWTGVAGDQTFDLPHVLSSISD